MYSGFHNWLGAIAISWTIRSDGVLTIEIHVLKRPFCIWALAAKRNALFRTILQVELGKVRVSAKAAKLLLSCAMQFNSGPLCRSIQGRGG